MRDNQPLAGGGLEVARLRFWCGSGTLERSRRRKALQRDVCHGLGRCDAAAAASSVRRSMSTGASQRSSSGDRWRRKSAPASAPPATRSPPARREQPQQDRDVVSVSSWRSTAVQRVLG